MLNQRKAERRAQLRDDPYYIIDDKPPPPDVDSIPVVRLEGMPSLQGIIFSLSFRVS